MAATSFITLMTTSSLFHGCLIQWFLNKRFFIVGITETDLAMKTGLYVLTMSLLMGCVTFRSNTNGIIPSFSRILVASKLVRISPTYLDRYTRSFPPGYTVCTVDIGPISFGSPDSLIRQAASQCNSEVILTLDVAQNLQGGSGKSHYNINDLLLEMATLPDRKPFWKAIVPVSAVMRDALYPPDVVGQLKEDGIISQTGPVKQ